MEYSAETTSGQRLTPEKESQLSAEIIDQESQPVSEPGFTPPTKEKIAALQLAMIPIQSEMPEAEHYFAPGMYGRKFTMPAGMLVVGKIHRHAHLMIVAKGSATIITEFGKEEVEAGYISTSQPGAKRVVLAHEETTFFTIHLNNSDTTDVGIIEAEHIIPDCHYLDDQFMKELLQ